MKKILAVMFAALFAAGSVMAATETGPRGGRLLGNTEPRAELLIDDGGVMSIAFYDEAKKQVPPGEQMVSATAEAPEGKTKVDFEKKGDLLVAKSALPKGEGYNIVLQLRKEPGSKPQNLRVRYDMHVCGECKHAEYACTCDH